MKILSHKNFPLYGKALAGEDRDAVFVMYKRVSYTSLCIPTSLIFEEELEDKAVICLEGWVVKISHLCKCIS